MLVSFPGLKMVGLSLSMWPSICICLGPLISSLYIKTTQCIKETLMMSFQPHHVCKGPTSKDYAFCVVHPNIFLTHLRAAIQPQCKNLNTQNLTESQI